MLHWLRIVAFLVTGAIFGPLLLAVLAGLHPEEPWNPIAPHLLAEYDARVPSSGLTSPGWSISDSRKCGYDPDALFTREDRDRDYPRNWQWTPARGYRFMGGYHSWFRQIAVDDRRSSQLHGEISNFSGRFLLACMRGTVFAPLCAQRTGALLGKWKSGDATATLAAGSLNEAGTAETLCTYLDGVAARRGLPLAKR